MASVSLNRVFLAGNLTRDPEVRYLPSGVAVAEFGLAVNERFRDSSSNDWKEKTVFVELVAWDRQAQTCGEYLKKGSPILAEGKLQFDQWENQQGEKRSKLRVNAQRVHFLGTPAGRDREARKDAPEHPSAEGLPPPPAAGGGAPLAEDTDNLPF